MESLSRGFLKWAGRNPVESGSQTYQLDKSGLLFVPSLEETVSICVSRLVDGIYCYVLIKQQSVYCYRLALYDCQNEF